MHAAKPSYLLRLRRDLANNRWTYAMLLPVLAYSSFFHYVPIYGALIAFKDFNPAAGMAGSEWVGLDWFKQFFNGLYFDRLMLNTLMLNVYDILLGFPAPIVLALLMNELTSMRFKQFVQTVTYLPHFISVVVVSGMVLDFLARDGVLTNMLVALGATPDAVMNNPDWFRRVYVGSEIWQSIAGARSSTWPRWPASILPCTRRRASMAPTAGSKCCISRCPDCCRSR